MRSTPRPESLKWKLETDGPVHATPAVHNGVVYLAGCDENFRAVRWPTARSSSRSSPAPTPPRPRSIDGDRAYFGTFNNEVLAIDSRPRRSSGATRTRSASFRSTRRRRWSAARVIVGSRDKLVHAIDAATGKPAWTFTTRARVDSSPAVAGGRVYVGSSDGRLYVLDARDAARRSGSSMPAPRSRRRPRSPAGAIVIGSGDGVDLLFRVIYNLRFTI